MFFSSIGLKKLRFILLLCFCALTNIVVLGIQSVWMSPAECIGAVWKLLEKPWRHATFERYIQISYLACKSTHIT